MVTFIFITSMKIFIKTKNNTEQKIKLFIYCMCSYFLNKRKGFL